MKDLESVDLIKTGTTTVAILCKDGVVVAADKRSTAGNLVANKRQVKVVQIADKMVVAQAGLVSDAQLLSKLIRAEVKLKDIQTAALLQSRRSLTSWLDCSTRTSEGRP